MIAPSPKKPPNLRKHRHRRLTLGGVKRGKIKVGHPRKIELVGLDDLTTHMVGVRYQFFDVAERAMQDLVTEGMTRVVFFVDEYDRAYEREFIRCLRGILFDLGLPMKNTVIIEGGVNFQNMARAKAEIVEQLKLGSQIVALEKHCAETVSHSLRDISSEGLPEPRIAAFVSSKPRLPDPGYRAFDMNLELCGRLAVIRLMELQRNPGLPPNSSYIYSPGWVS
jgi:DNA-binding LacI/PurR family transcriptional regulator